MAGNSLGSAGVQLYADTAQYQQDLGKAAAVAEREMRRIQRESQMAAAIVNELGRRMQITSDVTQASAQRQAMATQVASEAQRRQAATASEARRQMVMLNYQMTDIAVGLASGQSPFTVLMQQGGQLRDQAGSVRGALGLLWTGVRSLVTPFTAAAGAAALVVTEMVRGYQESQAYARQISLTGNFAAKTADQLRALAAAQADVTRRSVTDQQDTISALAGTGRFGPEVIEKAAQAMARFQKLTDTTAQEALKNFSSIADGAARWAADQNRQVHFLTAEQYRHIAALEKAGHVQQAMAEALRLYDQELANRHGPAIGSIERAWNFWAKKIDEVKRSLMNWGVPSTLGDQLAAAQQRVDQAQKAYDQALTNGRLARVIAERKAALDEAKAALEQIKARKNLEESAARAQAEIADREQRRIDELSKRPTGPSAAERRARQQEEEFQRVIGDAEDRFARRQALMKEEERRERDFQGMLVDAERRQAERDQARRDRGSVAFGMDEGAKAWWDDFTNQAKRGEALFTSSFQAMEDAVVSWAHTGKLQASDFFTSMADMYLREVVRMAQAALFFDKKGNFNWGLNIVQGIGSLLGFANGTPNVTQDGPYYLHAGERVLTAQENRAFSGLGERGAAQSPAQPVQNIYVQAGLGWAEVYRAIQAGLSASKADARNLVRNGGV